MRVPIGVVIKLGAIWIQYVRVFFPAANQTTPVGHDLESDAVGWSLASKGGFCDIKDAPVSNTRSAVHLVSDTAKVSVVVRLEAVKLSER